MNLATKYRPVLFSEVIGESQQIISSILANSIKSPHPLYIFVGESGIGKTTIARIFARAIVCENPQANGEPCNECSSCKKALGNKHPDIKEYDIGSLRGVDDIDKIKELLRYRPMMGHGRVVILDECHKMSQTAQESLLKTFEEPPKNTTFILCTTEGGFLKTTLTRAQIHTFENVYVDYITEYLSQICLSEKLDFDEKIHQIISESAKGSVRLGIKHLEKWIDSKLISVDDAQKMFPIIPEGDLIALAKMIISKQDLPKAEKLAYKMMTEHKQTASDLAIELMENFADYLYKNQHIGNEIVLDILNVRQMCLLELSYLRNTGSKWKPFRDFMFNLYYRPVAKKSSKKETETFSAEVIKQTKSLAIALGAVVGIKNTYIELKFSISGKIVYLVNSEEEAPDKSFFILISKLDEILQLMKTIPAGSNVAEILKQKSYLRIKNVISS